MIKIKFLIAAIIIFTSCTHKVQKTVPDIPDISIQVKCDDINNPVQHWFVHYMYLSTRYYEYNKPYFGNIQVIIQDSLGMHLADKVFSSACNECSLQGSVWFARRFNNTKTLFKYNDSLNTIINHYVYSTEITRLKLRNHVDSVIKARCCKTIQIYY